jgi:hypothetical protein
MSDAPGAGAAVPIACTLEADHLPERLAEWRTFGKTLVHRAETQPTSARFLLADGDDVLAAAVSLAQRETQCCAFFDFAVELGPEARWLSVRVPAGAEETLRSFLELLGSES